MNEQTKPSHPDRKGGFFTNVGSLVGARAFLALSQILVLPIVARVISIEEFAIMALAMTIVVFCSALSDAGLGRSLIRSDGYKIDEWSSVFWLLMLIGVVLSVGVIAIAPLWSGFFEEPRLAPVLMVMAIIPLCQSASAVPNAEIERREHYTAIARMQMTTTVVSLGLAVGLALAGAGVWALVAQQLALAVVRLIGVAWLTEFRPQFVFSAPLIKPHLKFARDAIVMSVIFAGGAQAGIAAIGKILGAIPLGIFSMSERFARLPQFGLAGPMSTVVYVRMAKAKNDPERLIEIYLSSMRLLALILMPGFAMVAVAGDSIFTVFLSADWAPVAPVFAFSIGGIVIEAAAIVCLSCLFRAVGRTELGVRLALESTILRLSLIVIGAFISLQAVAFGLSIWGLLIVPRGWMIARQVVPLQVGQCFKTMQTPVLCAASVIVAYVTFQQLFDADHIASIFVAIGIWAAAMATAFVASKETILEAIRTFQK